MPGLIRSLTETNPVPAHNRGIDRELLCEQFIACRRHSEMLCAGLESDDRNLQVAEFTSPAKWHLAHTTWFFETFLLLRHDTDYTAYNSQYQILFNSYYNGVGEQYPRAQRSFLSRPGYAEVLTYREHVNQHVLAWLRQPRNAEPALLALVVLGIEHEKQHQELFFTDLKYCLYQNPLYPAAQIEGFDDANLPLAANSLQNWVDIPAGNYQVGKTISSGYTRAKKVGVSSAGGSSRASGQGSDGKTVYDFAFDNEAPRHTVRLAPVQLQNCLVSNRGFMAFIEDGGYQAPSLWLADGWATVQAQDWSAPLYWVQRDGAWYEYSLVGGLLPLEPDAPVRHVSAYEADAYANWCQRRLPTEFEWEVGATRAGATSMADADNAVAGGWFGRCWQWTGSAYRPYPGFRVAEGAVGEYNGKFMGNQWVLRGSSSVTSDQHARTTYRNFFYLQDRWQYSGIRLARDV